jgi:hypothetical protein
MSRFLLPFAIAAVLVATPAPASAASTRWCDTATVKIGGWSYWPYGSADLRCRTIIRRSRALVLHNKRPDGWGCTRFKGGKGQPYGSCSRGKRYFGVSIPD